MSKLKAYVKLEFEPIVKLVCLNRKCKFHGMNSALSPDEQDFHCGLKQIIIDADGICKKFEEDKRGLSNE